MKNWLRGNDEGEADDPSNRDPEIEEVGEGGEGLVISRVKFDDLVKVFPNTQQVRNFAEWFNELLRLVMVATVERGVNIEGNS